MNRRRTNLASSITRATTWCRRWWARSSQRSKIVAFVLAAIVFGLGIYGWHRHSEQRAKVGVPVVVYKGDTTPPAAVSSTTLSKIPAGATSTVCTKVSTSAIQGAIGETMQPASVPLPDSKVMNGTWSGCSYAVAEKPKQQLRAVSISVRTYTDATLAQEAYERQTRENGRILSDLYDQAYYRNSGTQLLYRRGNNVVTIGISKLDPKAKLDEAVVRKIAKLIPVL